jgi:predicted enzyme related to lactoylglutathione lyase
MSEAQAVGSVGWFDVTATNAEELRHFYQAVVGRTASVVDMGAYSDFTMGLPSTGQPVTGICHARGTNAGLPVQWLLYITVADVEASAARCADLGGKVLAGPRTWGDYGCMCVLQDPAGAVTSLFTPAKHRA